MGFVLFDILLVYRYVGRWIPNLSSRLGFDHCQWYPSLYFPALSFFLFLALSVNTCLLFFFEFADVKQYPNLIKSLSFLLNSCKPKDTTNAVSPADCKLNGQSRFHNSPSFFFLFCSHQNKSYHYSLTLLLPTRSRVWSATLAGVLNELEKKDRERRWVFIL